MSTAQKEETWWTDVFIVYETKFTCLTMLLFESIAYCVARKRIRGAEVFEAHIPRDSGSIRDVHRFVAVLGFAHPENIRKGFICTKLY